MTRPILTTNDDIATIQVDVASARALGLTEEGIARLLLDARATAEVLGRTSATRWTVELVEPAEVIGETITDEQIRRLRAERPSVEVHADTVVALAYPGELDRDEARGATIKAAARARCAAAYNARVGGRS